MKFGCNIFQFSMVFLVYNIVAFESSIKSHFSASYDWKTAKLLWQCPFTWPQFFKKWIVLYPQQDYFIHHCSKVIIDRQFCLISCGEESCPLRDKPLVSEVQTLVSRWDSCQYNLLLSLGLFAAMAIFQLLDIYYWYFFLQDCKNIPFCWMLYKCGTRIVWFTLL